MQIWEHLKMGKNNWGFCLP